MTIEEIKEQRNQHNINKRIIMSCKNSRNKVNKKEDQIQQELDMFCLENDIGDSYSHPKELLDAYSVFGGEFIDELSKHFFETNRMLEKYGENEHLENHKEFLNERLEEWKENMNPKRLLPIFHGGRTRENPSGIIGWKTIDGEEFIENV